MDDELKAYSLWEEAWEQQREGNIRRGIELFEEAEGLVDPKANFSLYRKILHDHAQFLGIGLDNEEAGVQVLARLLALLETPAVEAQIQSESGVSDVLRDYLLFSYFARGSRKIDYRNILDVLDTAEAFLERFRCSHWRDAIMEQRATVLSGMGGHDEEALELMIEAMRLGEENGFSAPMSSRHARQHSLLELYYELERYEEAEQVARDFLGDESVERIHRIAAHNRLGHMLLERGEAEKALPIAEQGVEIAREMAPGNLTALLGLLFDVVEVLGQYERAVQIAEELLQWAREIDTDTEWRMAYHALAAAHLNLDELDKAEPYLEKAEALAKKLDAPTGRTTVQDDVAQVRARLEEKRSRRS